MGPGADQDRLLGLVDLVVGADADRGQLLALVGGAGPADGGRDDVGDAAQRERVVQQVAQELDDAAEGTVADQDEPQDDLTDQALGDGEVKQDTLVRGGGDKGLVEGLPRLVGLPVDELAADVVLAGEAGDRLRAGEGAYGQALALVGGKVLGGAGQGPLGLGGGRMGVHVCFLLRTGFLTVPV